MLFHSFAFLTFFPIVVGAYFLLPFRFRWMLLLAASYVFYGWWNIQYLALIALSTVIDYTCALAMDRCEGTARRRWLGLSLATNLGLLGWFKYASFFNESARGFAHWLHMDYPVPVLHILLPVGISFYTFQTLSYTIDVYRRDREPERHFGIFALYVAFFPQLVAGPIERSTQLLPQFRERHRFTWDNLAAGLRLMLLGYFLKVVIADRTAAYVNEVWAHADQYEGITLILGAYMFSFQIFGDFAGYSYIAIGAARIMGYRLMENFRRPYFTTSVAQFWREWHISLCAWFRDYIYIPLGGSRLNLARRCTNLMIVFAISGLWHGAKWTMIVFGLLHGLVVTCEIITNSARQRFRDRIGLSRYPRLCTALQITVTFHIVTLIFLVFRAPSLPAAANYIRRMATGLVSDNYVLVPTGDPTRFCVDLVLVGILGLMQWRQGDRETGAFFDTLPRWQLTILCYFFLFATLFFGAFTAHEFIYFQF